MRQDELEIIYDSMFFREIDYRIAKRIIDKLAGKITSYEKDSFVITEQDRVNQIGIILSGELCKVQHNIDGTELLMQKLKASYVIGLEIAVSEKQTSPYSVYTMFPSTVFWFRKEKLTDIHLLTVDERMWMHEKIFEFLANENIRQYKKIEILSCKCARDRITRYLEKQSRRYHSREFEIELNREQMANYLGLNRSVLSHELKKMEKEGILQVRKNHFRLLEN